MTTTDASVRIDLDLPPDFHEVPLDPAIEDRVAAQRELVDALGADPRSREGLGWLLEALARMTRDSHVSGTAFCAVEIDGTPSTATLTVATQAMPSDDPLVFAQGTYESLRAGGDHDSIRLRRLGPVTGVVAHRELEIDGRRSSEVTAIVPVPGHRIGVYVTVATDDVDHTEVYERVAVDAAGTVRVVPA